MERIVPFADIRAESGSPMWTRIRTIGSGSDRKGMKVGEEVVHRVVCGS